MKARCSVLLLLMTLGCATQLSEWQHAMASDHPLVGRIWASEAGEFVSSNELTQELLSTHWVLLGEKHDNLDHHRLQAWVITELVRGGRRPAMKFEMLMPHQARQIRDRLAADPGDLAVVLSAFDRSGWKAERYRELIDVIYDAGLGFDAANLSPAERRGVRQLGMDGLPDELVEPFGLDSPVDPALREILVEEIRQAHCGHASDAMANRLIEVQRAVDAKMAYSMLQGGDAGAVLIAGAGHVQRERAVPQHLVGPSLVIAFVEVQRDEFDPAAYPSGYDYLWFTPRVDDIDPCVKFREQLERMHAPKTDADMNAD